MLRTAAPVAADSNGVASRPVSVPAVSRRRALAAAAVGAAAVAPALAGCGEGARSVAGPVAAPAVGRGDLALSRGIATLSAELAGQARSLAGVRGAPAGLLRDLAVRHDAHRRAFRPEGEPGPATGGSAARSPGAPVERRLAALADAELTAVDLVGRAVLRARSGALARALASCAAGLQQNVALLRQPPGAEGQP